MISVEEAVKAQKALREATGKGPEMFPLPAFIGMISDEVETLRQQGKSDEEIAAMVEASSAIRISAEQIREHYATPEERADGRH